jgi:hypothetical protein
VALVVVGGGYYWYMGQAPANTAQDSGMPMAGKLDAEMVCRSALAYMTFADAAAAEVFVQECKEGKHPEVFDRYRADMGLGDGAAI